MSISRDTFNPEANYKRVRYHQDRDLLDSELNEQQDILHRERKKIADQLFKEGSVIGGLTVSITGNVLSVADGLVYIEGSVEQVPGAVLTYDPAVDVGADYVYVELLKYNYGLNHDAALINPATGEPTAEREKWVLALQDHDTSAEALPNNVTERKVVAIYKFDRETGEVTTTVQEKSRMYLRDLLGTLPGDRITVASITENQLAFAAAEGLNSLLDNLAERTFDQAGSYLVQGLDSFIGSDDGESVEVITNAGRAYIQGYRLQKDLPTTTVVPKSVATKAVRGEQKTYSVGNRRYPVNSTPLKATRQAEAIVAIVSNITRGSVGGGEDLLQPNPVVDILEVSQGATVYQEGVDWRQSGNHVDWLGSGQEPAIGTTYTVRWTYTRQMVRGSDYVDGGWFGESAHPVPAEYFYLVTAVDGDGETAYDADQVVSRDTLAGEINRLTWLPAGGATGYRIYRATQNAGRTDFGRLADVAAAASAYVDDGVDEIAGGTPPEANTSDVTMSPVRIALDDLSLVNFGRSDVGDAPVDGSNVSIDYDYTLGRKDVIYATTGEIKRLEGAPADRPKLPLVPEDTLALGSIDCPPNSVTMRIVNFGLTRVTMDRLHEIIQDVEDLKVNDAQFQMNSELQNRDAQTKKGIYSDDFSSDAQSDMHHDGVERAYRPRAPVRRPGPRGHVQRARGGPEREPGAVQREPGPAARRRDGPDRAERLVRGQKHQPLCGVREARGRGRGHTQHRPPGTDRRRRDRSQLHPRRQRRDRALRRARGRHRRHRRRGGTGERLVRRARRHPERQPYRRGDRRRRVRPDEPAGQRSAGDHPHPARGRQPHHRRAPDHRAHDPAPDHPRPRGAYRVALAVAVAPTRPPGSNLQLHPETASSRPSASSSRLRTPQSPSPFRSEASPRVCPTRSYWRKRLSPLTRSRSTGRRRSPSTIPSTPRRTPATRWCSSPTAPTTGCASPPSDSRDKTGSSPVRPTPRACCSKARTPRPGRRSMPPT